MSYLHGVETASVNASGGTVTTVASAVIGLIGTAPVGPVNTSTLLASATDAAQFGLTLPGFTIPQALAWQPGAVIAINVCNPAVHKTTVTNEAQTLDATRGTCQTAFGALQSLVVKNAAGTTTYVNNIDYSYDPISGTITWLVSGSIPIGATLSLSYVYTDPTKVQPSDIIGGINAAGLRLGMQALLDSYSLFGLSACILIAPVYCTQASVEAALDTMADRLGAVYYIDAPAGITPAQAIAGRGPAGTIGFNNSSDRARLCYPMVQVFDTYLNAYRLEGLSARAAALRAAIDINPAQGFHWSSSNQVLQGVTGVERTLSAQIDDPTCEVNQLNAVGITTVFNNYGTGYLLWGNRNASFPLNTGLDTFECARRTADMLDVSIRYFSMPYMDRPLLTASGEPGALIDVLVEAVNQYIRTLIGRGALVGGVCWFNKSLNPDTELGNGHLLLSYKFTPPPPLERLTWESEMTGEYLVVLSSSNQPSAT
jgi:phage tail sheath protein FI